LTQFDPGRSSEINYNRMETRKIRLQFTPQLGEKIMKGEAPNYQVINSLGKKIRLLCTDRKTPEEEAEAPIIGLLEENNGEVVYYISPESLQVQVETTDLEVLVPGKMYGLKFLKLHDRGENGTLHNPQEYYMIFKGYDNTNRLSMVAVFSGGDNPFCRTSTTWYCDLGDGTALIRELSGEETEKAFRILGTRYNIKVNTATGHVSHQSTFPGTVPAGTPILVRNKVGEPWKLNLYAYMDSSFRVHGLNDEMFTEAILLEGNENLLPKS
jgi:hypothetical protein